MQKANLGLQVSFYTPLVAYHPCLASSVGLCVSLSAPRTPSWVLSSVLWVFSFCYINNVLSHICLGQRPVKMCLIFKYSCKNSCQVLTQGEIGHFCNHTHCMNLFAFDTLLYWMGLWWSLWKKKNSQLSWYLYQSLWGSCHNLCDIRQ